MPSFIKTLYKLPKTQKIFYFLLFLLSINIISGLRLTSAAYEGFANEIGANEIGANEIGTNEIGANEIGANDFIVKKGTNLYDNFYVQVYDELLFSKVKNDFEIGELVKHTTPTNDSLVLDIGSGTGHHVSGLHANGIKAIGIDQSAAMVKEAKKTYPNFDYRVADALKTETFPAGTFSHITCFYFTIYYIENKRKFFENCIYWLNSGGYLILHLVDRNNFDPILPAGDPFKIISPQNYAKKRITSTVVKFNDFDYKSNFEVFPNDDTAVLNETFKYKNNNKMPGKKMRRNEHNFYMPTQKNILNMAKEVGFIVLSEVEMTRCQYSNQFIYILQKPS